MRRIPPLLTYSTAGNPDLRTPIAGSRAGALGIVDLTRADAGICQDVIAHAGRLLGRKPFGVRLGTEQVVEAALEGGPANLILHVVALEALDSASAAVEAAHRHRRLAIVEVGRESQAKAAAALGADGLVVVGEEAGGWVGRTTSLVLLQAVLRAVGEGLPVWVRGGIGLHNAAGFLAAGAAGVVLDGALALCRESAWPDEIRERLGAWDGTETTVQEYDDGTRRRVLALTGGGPSRPGVDVEGAPTPGQGAAFAADLGRRFVTVGGVVQAVRSAIDSALRDAGRLCPLAEGSPLAASHGTRLPIVQGPMTRVSDRAGFALAVAEGGALPLLALAMMRGDEVRATLEEAGRCLAGRPWGVGLLGFLPPERREAQVRAVLEVRPPFALIAGGRPDQARDLERAGISTYLHAPSPRLLDQFLRDGARRFVLEGRECGGHVGPRSSAVLWEQAIGVLLERIEGGVDPATLHVLFAGGIHDARSSAFVAATAAPLASRGVKVGVLLGTAYLFTEEAVASGAIVEGFQREALGCDGTALLETGPGHVVRVAPTPFVADFNRERERLVGERRGKDEIREALERLNVGRLRIAAKGVDRPDGAASPLVPVDAEGQRARGLYMLGEVASLRDRVTTIGALHREIAEEGTARLRSPARKGDARRGARRRPRPSNIAIVGMAAVVPGADSARAFWQNTLRGRDAITEVPPDRWDWRAYFDADPKAPDKITSRWGGFLPEVPFDPLRYGMPPASVTSIEPMQLIALEVARAALEDAGYGTRPFPRRRTAVVIGAGGGAAQLAMGYAFRSYLPLLDTVLPGAGTEALARCRGLLPEWTEDSFPGILLNVAAGRVANRFDLGGANYTVDAACGSSLAAAAAAVRELESRAADVVLLGGADTVQNPFTYLAFSKTQAFSARGRCRPFDAGADGIVISEAVAFLVLKRLDDAERDGDRIYAVLKGMGASSDGRAKGLTAPSHQGQVRALRRAYAKSGVSPATVGYVEAHGTGTAVGDVAEVAALTEVFGRAGAAAGGCGLGSVKSLIGHTKCAAGLAGLINATLALHHRVLPPTIGIETPNPRADVAGSAFHLSTRTRPWLRSRPDRPRRAGVSAFGFGGTNFHAVLEAYEGDAGPSPAPVHEWPSELFAWRAERPADLSAALGRALDALGRHPGVALRDVAHALAAETFGATPPRGDGWRLAVVAATVEELRDRLAAVRERLARDPRPFDDPAGISLAEVSRPAEAGLAFLFPGQGSQYPGMFEELAVLLPTILDGFERFDAALAALGRPAVGPLVFPPPTRSADEAERQRRRLASPECAQPALGAASVGLLDLLGTLGVEPDHLGGHSYGELVALHAAGVIPLGRLAELSEARGRLMKAAAGDDPGAMAAVRAGVDRVEALLKDVPGVVVANVNAPGQTVVSGATDAVRRLIDVARGAGITAQALPVACAFHSPIVAGAEAPLAAMVAGWGPSPPRRPVYSNLDASRYPDDPDAIARRVGAHAVGRVRFAEMVGTLYEAGARVFVEVGPGNVLTALVGSILDGREHRAIALDPPGRRGLPGLLAGLGRLFTAGVALDLRPLTSGRSPGALRWQGGAFEPAASVHTATTWLVNGDRARPAFGAEPARFGPGQALPAPPSRSPAASPMALELPRLPRGTDVAPDRVLAAFQENMRSFLDVQRSTMLSYLSGRPAASPAAQHGPPPTNGHHGPATNGHHGPATNGRHATAPPAAVVADPAPAAPAPVESTGEIAEVLVEIVRARTGYPAEMLRPEMDLEADLGIDSIKRVEILGSLRDRFPERFGGPEADAMERLSRARTLGAIVALLEVGKGSRNGHAPALKNGHAPAAPQVGSVVATPAPAPGAPAPLKRSLLRVVEAPFATAAGRLSLAGAVVVVTDDGAGVAPLAADRLRAAGIRPVLLRHESGPVREVGPDAYIANLASPAEVDRLADALRGLGRVAGLLHLSPLQGDRIDADPSPASAREARKLFLLARAFRQDLDASAGLGGAALVAATALGGCFGSDGRGRLDDAPGQGAVAGFMKALAREWPRVRARVVDVDPSAPADRLAAALCDELLTDDDRYEVGHRDGARIALEAFESALATDGPDVVTLRPGDPVLLTGGARGITAAMAEDLARRWRPTVLLLGRTALPDGPEPPSLAAIESPQALKEAILHELRSGGATPSPAALERAYRELVHAREIRGNLRRLESLGVRVAYESCDVRDRDRLAAILGRWREEYGPLAGFVHGAGLIEDRLIRDKSPESFDRVVGVKLDGALNLVSLVDPEPLRFAAFFSSVAGRFGNEGQSDYAAANEGLNKLALALDRRWSCRVVSMIWGPWAGVGMVSDLGTHLARRGIGLIDLDEGKVRLGDELRHGRKGDVEVIVAGPLGVLSDTSAKRGGS